jgi:hypothetical protein
MAAPDADVVGVAAVALAVAEPATKGLPALLAQAVHPRVTTAARAMRHRGGFMRLSSQSGNRGCGNAAESQRVRLPLFCCG